MSNEVGTMKKETCCRCTHGPMSIRLKGIVSQSVCKNLMRKLSNKLQCLGRHVMRSRLTRKYYYIVINW